MSKQETVKKPAAPTQRRGFTAEEIALLKANAERDPHTLRVLTFIDSLMARGATIDKAIYCAANVCQGAITAERL